MEILQRPPPNIKLVAKNNLPDNSTASKAADDKNTGFEINPPKLRELPKTEETPAKKMQVQEDLREEEFPDSQPDLSQVEDFPAVHEKILETAPNAGFTSFEKIVDDLYFLGRSQVSMKYFNKKISLSGKVTTVREANNDYTIVLGGLIDCTLEKSPELSGSKLKSIVGKRVALSGLCLGLRGEGRVVIVKAQLL